MERPPALTDEVPAKEPVGASPDWSDWLRWALLLGTHPASIGVAAEHTLHQVLNHKGT